jgi:hypothetical protein
LLLSVIEISSHSLVDKIPAKRDKMMKAVWDGTTGGNPATLANLLKS